MDADEAQKKIRAAAEAGRVTYASSDGVDSFPQEWVDEFLSSVVNVGSAWITDRSGLRDFGRERCNGARERIIELYGVDVGDTDNLLAIFRMIHAAPPRTPQ